MWLLQYWITTFWILLQKWCQTFRFCFVLCVFCCWFFWFFFCFFYVFLCLLFMKRKLTIRTVYTGSRIQAARLIISLNFSVMLSVQCNKKSVSTHVGIQTQISSRTYHYIMETNCLTEEENLVQTNIWWHTYNIFLIFQSLSYDIW